MIRIALIQEAFDAIASTLMLGSVGYENPTDEDGNRLIWLDHAVVARLEGACAVRARATATPSCELRVGGRLRRCGPKPWKS